MANRDYYIMQVPGVDTRRDAYNLTQAILHDDSGMARLIVEHQIGREGYQDLIADLAALAATLLKCMEPEYREQFMRVVREQCELTEQERADMRDRTGIEIA